MAKSRAEWQLPTGVGRGTWDYLTESAIATEYDSFHGQHPLMTLDAGLVEQTLRDYQPDCTIIADFGCGTARIARRTIDLGFKTLNVDLSRPMLLEAQKHLGHQPRAALVEANLVELQWLANESIDVGLCLFSSIGMIRGRTNRVRFLHHIYRTLRKGGTAIVHVHNRHQSWRDPSGPWWLASTWLKSWFKRAQCEFGDRTYAYRGLPKMFLHIYSRQELEQDLRAGGFESIEILPIDARGERLLPKSRSWLQTNAGGFFAICRR